VNHLPDAYKSEGEVNRNMSRESSLWDMCDLAFYRWSLKRLEEAVAVALAAYPATQVPFPDHFPALWSAEGTCICTHYLLLAADRESVASLKIPVAVLPSSLARSRARLLAGEKRASLRQAAIRLAVKRSGTPGKEFYPGGIPEPLDDGMTLMRYYLERSPILPARKS